MKRLLIIITLCEVIIGCSNKTSNNSSVSAAQENLKSVHSIAKAFETGDTSLIANSVDRNFVDHKDYGDVNGIDSLRAFILASDAHIKNLKMETMKELADDEYVMSWTQFSGTGDGQAGTMQGEFNVRGVEITKLKNGKATEHWEAMDMRDVARMIDKLTPDQNGDLTDSTSIH
jgi:hypothetical protein